MIAQKLHASELVGAGAKDNIFNCEARLTFTSPEHFKPYFEVGNEANFRNDKRDSCGKVGVVFNF